MKKILSRIDSWLENNPGEGYIIIGLCVALFCLGVIFYGIYGKETPPKNIKVSVKETKLESFPFPKGAVYPERQTMVVPAGSQVCSSWSSISDLVIRMKEPEIGSEDRCWFTEKDENVMGYQHHVTMPTLVIVSGESRFFYTVYSNLVKLK